MIEDKILYPLILGAISTFITVLPNEQLKITSSLVLVAITYFLLTKTNTIIGLFLTIYAIVLILIWNYLKVIEFNGYETVPLWLPMIIYVCISCLIELY